jgi:hypothetical protein
MRVVASLLPLVARHRVEWMGYWAQTEPWVPSGNWHSDLFYPPSVRSAEERLRFYAEQFNTVEVDSTYYALPAERNGKL